MVFRVGDPAIRVRWYFVNCDHNNMPLWTPFASANWVTRVSEAGALGEQPGLRPWANGSRPANAGDGSDIAVSCVEEHEDWWTYGIGSGEETGPYDDAGLPVCCTEGPPISLCGCTTAREIIITLHAPNNPCIDGVPLSLSWNEVLGRWDNIGAEPSPCGDCVLEVMFICIDAFPTQWLLLIQWRVSSGDPSAGCAGGSASVDFTQCLPIIGHPVSVWLPDPGVCPCTNGIVADTVTFDAVEA